MPPEPAIIGNSPTDRLLGMLIERTEALREETVELRKATDDLKGVSQEVRLMLENVARRLSAVEQLPIDGIKDRLREAERTLAEMATRDKTPADRLRDAETGAADWVRIKGKVIGYAFMLALAVLAVGFSAGVMGQAISIAFFGQAPAVHHP